MNHLAESSGLDLGHHALQIPEIFLTICGFLDKRHCAKLLCVSKFINRLVAPVVWGDVDVKPILLTIPGVTVVEENGGGFAMEQVFTFPRVLDLARFSLYAPLVQILQCAGLYVIPVSENPNLPRPLLPQLQRILLSIESQNSSQHISWISSLLHPGLLALELRPVNGIHTQAKLAEAPWTEAGATFGLVDDLSERCPRLESLHVYSRSLESSSSESRFALFYKIGTLRQLRSFSFNGDIIYDQLLRVLGELPHLETLSFLNDRQDERLATDPPIDLPESSFASLRHLVLYGIREYDMYWICQIPRLFPLLESASIVFGDYRFQLDLGNKRGTEVALTHFGAHSPHVKHLTLLLWGYCAISEGIVEKLKHMPLTYLNLGAVLLDFETGSAEAHWEMFLSAVPGLEELHIERERLVPQQVMLLASMLPSLRILVFERVNDEPDSSELETTIDAAQPITLCARWSFDYLVQVWARRFAVDASEPDAEVILRTARLVYRAWPNAKCEAPRNGGESRANRTDKAVALRLSRAIERLRTAQAIVT